MKKDKSLWQEEDWNNMRTKLELLTVEQLKEIAKEVGIAFVGDEPLTDQPMATVKEQIILVLDEASPSELKAAYERILSRNSKSK